MQDRQNEYIDHAWNEMRKLLDQEMPVRRRRPVWWWWVGAACLLGILWAGWYTWSQWQVAEPKVVDASAKKTEQKPSERSTAPAGVLPLPTDQVRSASSGEASSEHPPAINSPFGGGPQASIEEALRAVKIVDTVDGQTQNKVIAEQSEVSGAATAQTISRTARIFLTPLATLPSVLPDELIRPGQMARTPLFAVALPAKTKWSFGVEGALTSDIRSGITGGFAGLTAAWQHNRWSLHSGLGWARQNLSNTQGNFVNESLSADAPNPNLAPEQSRIPQPPASLVVRSSQLRVPLYAAYRLAPNWQVGAGIDVRYWLRARQQWSYGTNLDPNLQFDAAESFGALLGQAGDALPASAVNQWDAAPMVQLTYQANDRWQWSTGARLGLTDMSKIDNVTWYDRSLWVRGVILF